MNTDTGHLNKKLLIEGGIPVSGNVKISGSVTSAEKLLIAALFSNEDVVLDNVPRVQDIEIELEIIRSIGAYAEWQGKNRLVLNGSGISFFEVPYELGSLSRLTGLLAPVLLFRFGKALIPKPKHIDLSKHPIDLWIETWKSLGIEVVENEKYISLLQHPVETRSTNFKRSTHTGTDNAIMSCLLSEHEVEILNAAEEPEIDDLIELCNLMGADVRRTDTRRIRAQGARIYKGANLKVQQNRHEAVLFSIAALLTHGNLTIEGVERTPLLSFLSVLSKMEASFEFSGNDLRIWRTHNPLTPVNVSTSPAPGFMTDWHPPLALLLSTLEGESVIKETVYKSRSDYIKELNRMGAKIEYIPGDSEDTILIKGPAKLKNTKIHINDLRNGPTLLLAALTADGKSEVSGIYNVDKGYEDFTQKLIELGAHIYD